MLVAALLALNQAVRVRAPLVPSGFLRLGTNVMRHALVVQRRGLRTRNAATWVRVPPGALGSFFDNSDVGKRAHDVAVAYRLAMAEVRVRLPLGTSPRRFRTRAWESLAIRLLREQEIAGSNPAALIRLSILTGVAER